MTLTAMLGAKWPANSIWAIGTLVGAGVLFSGITRIVTSGSVRGEVGEFQRTSAAA